MTKIGFTGSRRGLTAKQKIILSELIPPKSFELHHGDCVGADEWAHEFVYYYGHHKKRIVVHPPSDPKLRAFCGLIKFSGDFVEIREEKEYLERNKDIVDETEYLLAFPNRDIVHRGPGGGGTWSTVRYAKSVGKPVTIVYMNGNIDKLV